MITTKRTDSDDQAFKIFVNQLDRELMILDGEEHLFYKQLNKTDKIRHVIVAYDNDECVGCGAIREYSKDVMEIKRMYVLPNNRGKGIASIVLKQLEDWGKELNCKELVLETGKKQPGAIGLYKKNGYKIIPSYGKYKNVENSICFKKELEQ